MLGESHDYILKNLDKVILLLNKRGWEAWPIVYPPAGMPEITFNQQDFLRNVFQKNSVINIYTHVPFCVSQCDYCPYFKAFPNGFRSEDYVTYLCNEISYLYGNVQQKKSEPKKQLQLVYIGGGTPTILKPKDIVRYFEFLDEQFERTDNFTATIEATPYSINKELAEAFVTAGIDTVILGIQSFNEEILKKINRPQKNSHVENAVRLLREAGVKKVYFDLIIGLENQSKENLENEIAANFVKYRPDGYRTYLLQHYEKHPKQIKDQSEYETIEFLDTYNTLYSKKLWVDFEDIIGIGLGATSHVINEGKYKLYSIENTMSYSDYCRIHHSGELNNLYTGLEFSRETSLKRYIIRRFTPFQNEGIKLEVIDRLWDREYLFHHLKSVQEYLIITDDEIFLNFPKYLETMPNKTSNNGVNYFLFCLEHFYSEDVKKMLINQLLK